MARSSVCRVMQGSCPFWWPQQVGVFLASARKTAVEGNAAERKNSGLLAAREAVRGDPRLCCTRLCVSAPVAHGNLVLRAAPQTQEVTWASGPPASRTSDGRLYTCCVMDRWPVRWCGLRRPAVGTHVMAMQLGCSRTQQFPTSESCQHFWPFGTTTINLDSILCLLKFPEATFDGGHVCSIQPNIPKTHAPQYINRNDACTRQHGIRTCKNERSAEHLVRSHPVDEHAKMHVRYANIHHTIYLIRYAHWAVRPLCNTWQAWLTRMILACTHAWRMYVHIYARCDAMYAVAEAPMYT